MVDKIALEEHFAVEETLMDSAGFVPEDHWSELKSRILDIHDRRLRLMDAHNIERMILSLKCAGRSGRRQSRTGCVGCSASSAIAQPAQCSKTCAGTCLTPPQFLNDGQSFYLCGVVVKCNAPGGCACSVAVCWSSLMTNPAPPSCCSHRCINLPPPPCKGTKCY
jgi:hypothetical protein